MSNTENSDDQSQKPETTTTETKDKTSNGQEKLPIVTANQAMEYALGQELEGVILVGIGKNGQPYLAASDRYDYPPEAIFALLDAIDTVKELARRPIPVEPGRIATLN